MAIHQKPALLHILFCQYSYSRYYHYFTHHRRHLPQPRPFFPRPVTSALLLRHRHSDLVIRHELKKQHCQ